MQGDSFAMWVCFVLLVISMILTFFTARKGSRFEREAKALRRVAGCRLVVFRNDRGAKDGLGTRIVDDSFESLYLLAKYGGMMPVEGHEYAINTAYGTMTVAIDFPKEE